MSKELMIDIGNILFYLWAMITLAIVAILIYEIDSNTQRTEQKIDSILDWWYCR